MKDAYEVLHQKEAELARLRKEIQSLNIVASLLADHGRRKTHDETLPSERPIKKPSGSVTRTGLLEHASESTGSHSSFSAVAASRAVLDVLKRTR